MGPPVCHWCMRMEAKHKQIKKWARQATKLCVGHFKYNIQYIHGYKLFDIIVQGTPIYNKNSINVQNCTLESVFEPLFV